jgi:hypothetical protein
MWVPIYYVLRIVIAVKDAALDEDGDLRWHLGHDLCKFHKKWMQGDE